MGNIIFIGLAYLFGSISAAIIVCKVMGHPDPREHGSNNPGATNVLRLYGKQAALITLTGDLLKGLIPLLIGKALGVTDTTLALMGLAAFLGHLYPVFFRFEGGKGVATIIGVLFGYHWVLGACFMLTWTTAAFLFKYSSLSALIASLASIGFVYYFMSSPMYLYTTIIMVALLYWRHQSNIRKLINGEEDKLGKK